MSHGQRHHRSGHDRAQPDARFLRQTIAGGSIPIGQMSEWIEDPQGMLPGNDMVIHLSNDEITAVLAYLDTLK